MLFEKGKQRTKIELLLLDSFNKKIKEFVFVVLLWKKYKITQNCLWKSKKQNSYISL